MPPPPDASAVVGPPPTGVGGLARGNGNGTGALRWGLGSRARFIDSAPLGGGGGGLDRGGGGQEAGGRCGCGGGGAQGEASRAETGGWKPSREAKVQPVGAQAKDPGLSLKIRGGGGDASLWYTGTSAERQPAGNCGWSSANRRRLSANRRRWNESCHQSPQVVTGGKKGGGKRITSRSSQTALPNVKHCKWICRSRDASFDERHMHCTPLHFRALVLWSGSCSMAAVLKSGGGRGLP